LWHWWRHRMSLVLPLCGFFSTRKNGYSLVTSVGVVFDPASA